MPHLSLSTPWKEVRYELYSTVQYSTEDCVDPAQVWTGVKRTLVQALRLRTGRTAHRGNRDIAILSLDHGTRRGEGSASRPGRSLPPGKTRYLLYRRLGGPQGQSGHVRKISPPPGFDPRTIQPVASRYTDYATRLLWTGVEEEKISYTHRGSKPEPPMA